MFQAKTVVLRDENVKKSPFFRHEPKDRTSFFSGWTKGPEVPFFRRVNGCDLSRDRSEITPRVPATQPIFGHERPRMNSEKARARSLVEILNLIGINNDCRCRDVSGVCKTLVFCISNVITKVHNTMLLSVRKRMREG